MRAAAAVALAVVLVACASPAPHTVFVPHALTDCPAAAVVPRGIPPVVGPATLRAGFDRTETARQRDHIAAVECRLTLHDVLSVIADFNEQQRKVH